MLHQLGGRRGAGGDADGSDALDPARVERVGIGNEIGGHALLGGDLAQAVGVRAVGGADDEDDVDIERQLARGVLAVLRRVADVLGIGADDGGEALAQRIDDRAGVVDAERRLGDEGELGRVAHGEVGDFLGAGDEMDLAVDPPHGAFDLGMPGMADEDDLAPLIGIALPLAVHLGDQRAGGVDHRQVAPGGGVLDRAGDAMGAEDGDAARGDLVEFVDEMRAFGAQPLHHMAVVHDLVPDIDRRAVFLDRPFDDLDRPLDTGTKAPGLGQDHPHTHSFRIRSSSHR